MLFLPVLPAVNILDFSVSVGINFLFSQVKIYLFWCFNKMISLSSSINQIVDLSDYYGKDTLRLVFIFDDLRFLLKLFKVFFWLDSLTGLPSNLIGDIGENSPLSVVSFSSKDPLL